MTAEDEKIEVLDTTTWKTYTGEFGRIQFKYPENWNTEEYLKKLEQDNHPEFPDLYANSRYLEESVCESVSKVVSGYGGNVSLCSAGITIVPKFSTATCMKSESADYKLCSFIYSRHETTDYFSKDAVFTKNGEDFRLSFTVNTKHGELKPEDLKSAETNFNAKYKELYSAIFDSVEILDLPEVVIPEPTIYKNEEFGFKLEMTENWNNFKTKFERGSINNILDFCVLNPKSVLSEKTGEREGYACLFKIIIADKKGWEKDAEPCLNNPTPEMMCDWVYKDVINSNDSYVFSYGQVQDYGDEDEIYVKDAQSIRHSFRFLK